MIDSRLILEDFEESVRRLGRKGVQPETLETLREHLLQRKELVFRADEKRAALNKLSSEIGELFKSGQKDEANAAKRSVAEIKESLAALDSDLKVAEEEIEKALLDTPNFPADDVPDGKGEEENVVLRTHGYDEASYQGREYLPHWDLADQLGIWEVERASKVSGSGFPMLRGDGSRLLRALVRFGLDIHQEKYEEILCPHFVTTETFTATGHLPKFASEAYRFRDDDLWAIPTGEVPLMGLHRGEILEETDLPLRYMTHTACFRREAGAAGKDTRGLQRLHEFHKVELVKICRPENGEDEFKDLVADAERALQLLELPYRVVELCTVDLTFGSSRIYDLEVYAPGVDKWLEVSSIGLFTDYQARRGKIRFRRQESKKVEFVHALNGSGLATPRVWAAILENYQNEDGSVRIPKALVDYLGKERLDPPRSA